MRLSRLTISDVRNIKYAELSDLSMINIIHGRNGAGKTSVLESIYTLSTGKSFRSHKLKPIIRHESGDMAVFAELISNKDEILKLGIQRNAKGIPLIKFNGKAVKSVAELAFMLPVQVIYADTFNLIIGGPSERRQFLDWGVFHVEHSFYKAWRELNQNLKQRNSLLKHGKIADEEFTIWSKLFVESCLKVDALRREYFNHFKHQFEKNLFKLSQIDAIELHYYCGWNEEQTLEKQLNKAIDREFDQGYSLYGAHRADIKIKYKGYSAAETLSRGQQKLVISALKITQTELLATLKNQQAVVLIDDLPAELDEDHRIKLCRLLKQQGMQIFISCVEPADLEQCWPENTEVAMFHVEHGIITQ